MSNKIPVTSVVIYFNINFSNTSNGYEVKAFYELPALKGNLEGGLSWILSEDMRISLKSHHETVNHTSNAMVSAFYINPNKSFSAVRLGCIADVNNGIWKCAAFYFAPLSNFQRVFSVGLAATLGYLCLICEISP